MQPVMTTKTHSSKFVRVSSALSVVGRWLDTIGKKIRNAAISSAAETGSNICQCHSYTPATQRSVTPKGHITNEVQGAHSANGLMRRSFGIE